MSLHAFCMSFHEFHRFSQVSMSLQSVPGFFHKSSRVFNEFPWVSMKSHELSRISMKLREFSMCGHGVVMRLS